MTEYYEQVVGYDPKGVKRTHAPNVGECYIETEAYIRGRLDTGPIEKWRFSIKYFRDDVCYKRLPVTEHTQP